MKSFYDFMKRGTSSYKKWSSSQRRKGTSLIEILFFLSFLTIFLLIAIPNFVTFYNKHKFTNFTSEVEHILKWSKYEAMKTKTHIGICFDNTNRKIRINDLGTMITNGCSGNLLREIDIPTFIEVKTLNNEIVFDSRGLSLGENDVNISFKDICIKLKIKPFIGYVTKEKC